MSGLGNDFILVDNREGVLGDLDKSFLASKLCTPRLSIGADELMILEQPRSGGHLFMRTFNPDGQEVKMCGNASRCVARYAATRGIAPAEMVIETLGGPVKAFVEGESIRVELSVTAEPESLELQAAGRDFQAEWLEITGAPHAVVRFPEVAQAQDSTIHEFGSAIRWHSRFPQGTNVNFVEIKDRHALNQRTFERGVEGETLACGTGATASVLALARFGLLESPVSVSTRGGILHVSFEKQGEKFRHVYLGGEARFIAEGTINPEAWNF
jgi:diaminopimelate epimerase